MNYKCPICENGEEGEHEVIVSTTRNCEDCEKPCEDKSDETRMKELVYCIPGNHYFVAEYTFIETRVPTPTDLADLFLE